MIGLGPGEVHLWRACLDPPRDRVAASRAILSTAERERAAAIGSRRERRRWSVARAALRRVLAPYAGASPERLVLEHDRRGRPILRGQGPRFGLAHSGELALIAVGTRLRLGVDVELVRPLAAFGPLARRCLTDAERRAVEALPRPDRPRALLARWVRKEAYLKALGVGLRVDPRRVESGLDVAAGDRAARGRRRPGRGWLVLGLEPAPGYVAALAVRETVTSGARAPAARRRGAGGRIRSIGLDACAPTRIA